MTGEPTRQTAEERFHAVFAHLGAVRAYARRRGSTDAEALAADVMTVAWRRLADLPADDPLPWLYATARNLVLADRRQAATPVSELHDPVPTVVAPEVHELDPALAAGLKALSTTDREALLLVAWEDLTPGQAARTLGISPVAFRVRLLRARRRLRALLDAPAAGETPASLAPLDAEGTP